MNERDTTAGTEDFLGQIPEVEAPYGVTVIASDDADVVGKQIVLDGGLILGRSGESDVFPRLVIKEARVSRKHATIRRLAEGGDAFEIYDEGSHNGTFVDGARVSRAALARGAIVRVGNTLLELGPVAPGPGEPDDTLVGRAPVFLDAVARAMRVAPSLITVLIVGETGTGKDVLARRIHEHSGRRGAFIAVNCAAIPTELSESMMFGHRRGAFTGATADSPGFFGEAEAGTLFLDEVGELPLGQQAKLLRALENREYTPVGSSRARTTDTRIVAATNADLAAAVMGGRFRDDLYARLAGAIIELPPLRARRSDIPLLFRHFLAELAPERKLEPDVGAIERLLRDPWRHNVRQLRSLAHRVIQLKEGDGAITAGDVDAVMSRSPTSSGVFASVNPEASTDRGSGERPGSEELAGLLARHRGNVARVAAHYGKDAKQIYRWLKRYHLDPDKYR